ncbi:MAG: hypothetical protein M3024_00175, partial [Candidatus Dormibacteraeota bacterium]|nr:hypothetical protein [Candidatus Dormibacteraeota bacterium]
LEPGDTLLGRLSPILDLGLFSEQAGAEGIAAMLERGAVVRLARLPGDEIKSAVAEFLLLALRAHIASAGETRGLRWLLVMDEGWRLAGCPAAEPLLREGRGFGLACVLATQLPRDMPLALRSCAATQLVFGQTSLEQMGEIQRSVLGASRGSGADKLAAAVRGLGRFQAILHSDQVGPALGRRESWAAIRVRPHFELAAGRADDADPEQGPQRPRLAFSPGLEG